MDVVGCFCFPFLLVWLAMPCSGGSINQGDGRGGAVMTIGLWSRWATKRRLKYTYTTTSIINPFKTASPVLGGHYLEIDWFIPKTGPQSKKGYQLPVVLWYPFNCILGTRQGTCSFFFTYLEKGGAYTACSSLATRFFWISRGCLFLRSIYSYTRTRCCMYGKLKCFVSVYGTSYTNEGILRSIYNAVGCFVEFKRASLLFFFVFRVLEYQIDVDTI